MFCKNCGRKLEDDEKFCKNCGQKVTHHESIHKEAGEAKSVEPAKNSETKSEGSGYKVFAIILVLAFVGFVVYAISAASSVPAPFSSSTSTVAGADTSPNNSLTQTSGNQQSQNLPTTVAASTPKSTSKIAAEWSPSTAYVVCDWYYSDGSLIQELSGSGLLATLNSTPTIITNKHVVYDPTYGYTSRCEIKFPDDDGGYVYSSNDNGYPNYGSLTIDSNGNDVAYISGMHWVHLYSIDSSSSVSDQITTPPSISLADRSKDNSFACSSSENAGDPILVLGYPADGPQINQFGSQTDPTITEGIISGMDGIYYTTSAKIDHGNSGGLAIDETNDCYAGIPTWVVSDSLGSLGRILPVSTFLHN
jgi:hypothetical protein